jgi:hypothetical protein
MKLELTQRQLRDAREQGILGIPGEDVGLVSKTVGECRFGTEELELLGHESSRPS